MEENNYYEMELEQKIDNFDVNTVIDYVMGFMVCVVIITCLVLNFIHLKECIFQKKFENEVKKMRDEEEKYRNKE